MSRMRPIQRPRHWLQAHHRPRQRGEGERHGASGLGGGLEARCSRCAQTRLQAAGEVRECDRRRSAALSGAIGADGRPISPHRRQRRQRAAGLIGHPFPHPLCFVPRHHPFIILYSRRLHQEGDLAVFNAAMIQPGQSCSDKCSNVKPVVEKKMRCAQRKGQTGCPPQKSTLHKGGAAPPPPSGRSLPA